MSARIIRHHYQDPLDLIWLRVVKELGWELQRSNDAYASWDGRGTLSIAHPDQLDADDSLAQLVFHEICHALVGGSTAYEQVDWGLSNCDDRDLLYEHACHRLQAALAERYGLRAFMAVTTDWRPYWDALPSDPLAEGEDLAIRMAQEGYVRGQLAPFKLALKRGLSATARIADLVRDCAEPASLWRTTQARHKSGYLLGKESAHDCATCAWRYEHDDSTLRCHQSRRDGEVGPVIHSDEPGCDRWEPSFLGDEECGRCGACCRKGFDLVQVGPNERFAKLHPDLISVSGVGSHLPRPGGTCPMLQGDGRGADFRCKVYQYRPMACGEFPVRGEACLLARQRVGLSR